MIGTTVSHYKILEKIGEGGMGEVYLAEDTKLRRKVTLKFLAEKLTADEERKERFVQEARAAAAVEHPHIAAIYDVDEADGRTFIAMEYVRGESLREAIQNKTLNVRKSIELATQISDGLSMAHQRGVVHRDLKPENILLSEQGYAKIIDFGLAKLTEPLFTEEASGSESPTQLKTREGMVMGTVAYMSPEQAQGRAIDARSDIFSFGVLLDEMLSGESPFRRDTAIETLNAILKEPMPNLTIQGATVPHDLDRVLRKTLQKDPDQRYQTMKDVANDLRELRDEMTSATRPAVVVSSKTNWTVVALVAVLVAVGLWFFLGRDRGPTGIGASGRPSVAVMYFESMSGDEEIRWLSKGLPNMLVTDLAQTPGLDVVSSQRIHEILKQVGQENLESIDKSLVAEVARKAGAGAVVVGSIFKSGDEVRIDVQVEDVASGRVLSADSVRGDDVFPLVDELTGRIRSSLNVGDQPAGRRIAEVTTPSLEAYQLFSEAYEAHFNVRYDVARELYEKALTIDPSFAMAHHQLSNLAQNRGDLAVAKYHIDQAYEHLDRLPERQQLLVQASHAFLKDEDFDKTFQFVEKLVERYPDDGEGYVFLIVLHRAKGQNDEALAAAERAVRALPNWGPIYNMYGYELLDQGRYPEAIRAFETYAKLTPGEPNGYDSLAEALLITGQPGRALEEYTRAREMDPEFRVAHIGKTYAYGVLGRYDEFFKEAELLIKFSQETGLPPSAFQYMRSLALSRVGRFREAEDALREGLEIAGRTGDVASQAALELLSALHALERRNYRRTLDGVDGAEALIPEMDSVSRNTIQVMGLLLAGTADARSGDLDAARRRLEQQAEILDSHDPAHRWWHKALEGEIALAAGDLDAAETAFMAGEPVIKMSFSFGANPGVAGTVANNCLPFHDGLARVKKAQGDLEGAIDIYRDLLTPRMSSKWTAWLEPRYVLALARLLDETGDKVAARTEYERFLELWKDADEGLPELEEARKYVGT